MLLTLLEAAEMTTANIFTQAGEVLTGIINISVNFIGTLWSHPIGIVVIVLPFVGMAIGLAYRLFLRKKHV